MRFSSDPTSSNEPSDADTPSVEGLAPEASSPGPGSGSTAGPPPGPPPGSLPSQTPGAFVWIDENREHLLEHFGGKDHRVLAREIGCTTDELQAEARRAYTAQEVQTKEGPWAPDEGKALKRYLGAVDLDLIGRMIGRSVEAIEAKLVELAAGLVPNSLEAKTHVEFKRLYGTRADEDLALIFGRQLPVVQALAAELCLSKDKGFMRRRTSGGQRTKMPRWSSEELDQLREIYPKLSNLEIAKILGRSVKSIVSKAHSMRLKKDKTRLREMGQENVQLRQDR